jgi:murein DD-endopeptidase MepM/ murein hydrolase activator NlpD
MVVQSVAPITPAIGQPHSSIRTVYKAGCICHYHNDMDSLNIRLRSRQLEPKVPLITLQEVVALAVAFLAAGGILLWQAEVTLEEISRNVPSGGVRSAHVTRQVTVGEGDTYSLLMERAGVSPAESSAIFTATEDVYDLSRVRLDRTIDLTYGRDSGELEKLTYQIDSEERLTVKRDAASAGWQAARQEIAYQTQVRTASGQIESSLYASGLKQDLDERAIIALADVFQWTIDFVMDVRKGDTYKFIFEERYLDGEYVMPGSVLAAKYVNAGQDNYAFRFTDSNGETGYYDETGESVQRQFLRAPAAFKYISSGFTTGQRYISAFNVSTGHRAIDYAAPTGTPVRSVGAGTVVRAGWNGPYGNFVSVRHNSTYTTNYAHLSRIMVSYGQKVSQGQTIGLVGSTGFSTGPHLHYEMVKWGTKINPLLEEFPPVKPVPDEDKDRYLEEIAPYLEQLR